MNENEEVEKQEPLEFGLLFDDYDNYDTADVLPNGYDACDVYDYYEEMLLAKKEEKDEEGNY